MTVARWAAVLVLAAGCSRGVDVRPDRRVAAPPGGREVAQGTLVSAQLRQPLSTDRSRPGDRFTAELLDPLMDGEGEQVVPPGAIVEGVVTKAEGSSLPGADAQLRLDLTGVRLPGTPLMPLELSVADSSAQLESPWATGLLAALAGAAAGVGTGLAIDHEEATTVAGSAVIGLGVGAVLGWMFSPRQAQIPAGSVLTLRLERALPTEMGLALREKRQTPAREPLPEGEERRTGEERDEPVGEH